MERCAAIVQEYEPLADKSAGLLSIEGFTRYLLGIDGELCNPQHRAHVYQVCPQHVSAREW